MGCNVSWESWFIKTSYCCEGRSWLTYLINYNTVSRTAPARPSHLVRVLEKYTTYNISVPTPPQLLAWVDLPCQIDLCIKNIYIYIWKRVTASCTHALSVAFVGGPWWNQKILRRIFYHPHQQNLGTIYFLSTYLKVTIIWQIVLQVHVT